MARIIGAKLTDIGGGQVVVDNRGGADGIIGTEVTTRSPGDGYTLLIHSGSITYDPTLHNKLPYDTMKDLVPVGIIGTTPNLLVVTPSFRARSVRELLSKGRERPGSLTFATGGFGSSSHLAVKLFGYMSGVTFNHVPYKGAGPALADVVAGHVDFTVATMPSAIQPVHAGSLRALGISSLKRSTELPNVPTIAEAGLLGGYFRYHAVPTNSHALMQFRNGVVDRWRRQLSRRSQKGYRTWTWMDMLVDHWLPRPRILHPWPEQRFAVTHPR